MASIVRIFRNIDFDGVDLLPEHATPQHSFLIYTADDGHKEVIRGGQYSDGVGKTNLLDASQVEDGDLLVVYDNNYVWDSRSASELEAPIDFDTSGTQVFHTYKEFEGSEKYVSQIWDAMVDGGQYLDYHPLTYRYLNQNCNTSSTFISEKGWEKWIELGKTHADDPEFAGVKFYGLIDPVDPSNPSETFWAPGLHSKMDFSHSAPEQVYDEDGGLTSSAVEYFKSGLLNLIFEDFLDGKGSETIETIYQLDKNPLNWNLYPSDNLSNFADQHGVTLQDILDCPGNEGLSRRLFTIGDENSHQYVLMAANEVICYPSATSDSAPSYGLFRNGQLLDEDLIFSSDNDVGLPDNTHLDFESNLSPESNNVADTSHDWEEGAALAGGDYTANMPVEILNGDGFGNTEPSRFVTDDFRPGAQELVDNYLTNSIDDLINFVDPPTDMCPIPNQESALGRLSGLYMDAPNLTNVDPLVLDLNGDGVQLISYEQSLVSFNVDDDPYIEATGWVSSADGIVVDDKNGDGIINDITETLSEYYTDGVVDGLSALATLDSNQDGVFDNQDQAWTRLRVWQDANSDGVTDKGELKTFTELGIAAIDLDAEVRRHETLAGNPVLSRSTMRMSDGSQREVAAVDFATNPLGYEWNNAAEGATIHFEGSDVATYIVNDINGQTVSTAKQHVTTLIGNRGDDSLIGDERANWLIGAGGRDTLRAGAGDDFLIIDADDDLANIDAGEGFDNVRIADSRGMQVNLNQIHAEVLQGGSGNDVIISGANYNTFISGGKGNDTIIGGAADDALAGEDGNDLIDGGLGDDIIRGHRGNDTLIGNEGNDYLDAGAGDDRLYGGLGNDIMVLGQGSNAAYGGDGFDMVEYKDSYTNYTVQRTGYGFLVTNINTQAQDKLYSVEKLRFNDINLNIHENNTIPMGVRDDLWISGRDTRIIHANELLANDWNLDNEALHIDHIENIKGGTARLLKNGDIEFTPDPYFIGTASFDYLVCDEDNEYTSVYLNHDIDNSVPMLTQVNLHNSDSPIDPLFYSQWYFDRIRMGDVWDEYTGQGLSVGIFELDLENPFDFHHTDLDGNTSASTQATFATAQAFNHHATLVAGVIAAERNGEGSIGVAYDTQISYHGLSNMSSKFILNNIDGLRNLVQYDVANNSWSFTTPYADNITRQNDALSIEVGNALSAAAAHGRQGLGTIVVQAAGNERAQDENVNHHSLLNSRFNITVGSLNQEADLSHLVSPSTPFSTPGAAILVSAPGSNIRSTSVAMENENGTSFGSDYANTSGTSFSTPIVSGLATLMLQANPHLGYRDIQTILAHSARHIDDDNTTWHFNGATTANGGALAYSADYGFGLVDVHAAVRLAESWNTTHAYSNEEQVVIEQDIDTGIRDNATLDSTVTIDRAIKVENAEVTLSLTHARIQDLVVTLISPCGTESVLLDHPLPDGDNTEYTIALDSVNFYGEDSQGEWRLRIQDTVTGEEGHIGAWRLHLSGSDDQGNDTYVFTDSLGYTDQGQHVIHDGKGIDTINAAAIVDDVRIDLHHGASSQINGQVVALSTAHFDESYYAKQAQLNQLQQQYTDKQQALAQAEQARVDDRARFYALEPEFNDWNSRTPDIPLDSINAKREELNRLATEVNSYTFVTAIEYGHQTPEQRTYMYHDSQGHDVFWNYTQHIEFQHKIDHALQVQDEFQRMVDSYNTQITEIHNHAQSLLDQLNQLMDLVNTTLPAQIAQLNVEIPSLQQQITNLQTEIDRVGKDDTYIENAVGGDGNDVLIGNERNNTLSGNRGSDTYTGDAGADIFVIKMHANDADVITDFDPNQAGEKIDLTEFQIASFAALIMRNDGANVVIDLPNQQTLTLQDVQVQQLQAQHFTGLLDEVINLQGTEHNDILFADLRQTQVDAAAGDDHIHAGIGNSELTGGEGQDTFVIHQQARTLTTITDLTLADKIDLSGFKDVHSIAELSYQQQEDGLLITLADHQQLLLEHMTQAEVDPEMFVLNGTYYGSDADDHLEGSLQAEIIDGLGGNDWIWGFGYADTLLGGAGNDRLYGGHGDDIVSGGLGNDECYGGTGNDKLWGGAGDDILAGLTGNDTLDAGSGYNLLSGGEGVDKFVVKFEGDGVITYDVVTDFDVHNGEVIDLSQLTYIDNEFTSIENLKFTQVGSTCQIDLSTGSGKLDNISIILQGVLPGELTDGNFYFGQTHSKSVSANIDLPLAYDENVEQLHITGSFSEGDLHYIH